MLRGVSLIALLALIACSDDSPTKPSGGTETNVMGVPCTTDAECGEELRCLPFEDAGKRCQMPTP